MTQATTEPDPSHARRHRIALVLGGAGLFILGAVIGTVSLHFWMREHDFRGTVPTAEFLQDWQLVCPPLSKTTSGCVARETVIQQQTNAPVAQLQIDRGANADTIRIVVPLGVLLTPGLSFSPNSSVVLPIPYATCDFSGCLAVAQLTDEEVQQMKQGGSGMIGVVDRNAKAVKLQFSLKGFADAMRERDDDWRRRTGHWF
jgi:invasion protein IalB